MEFLQHLLDESLALTNRLLLHIESNEDDIKRCISGELLDSYISASHDAGGTAEKIRKNLMILQAGQKPDL